MCWLPKLREGGKTICSRPGITQLKVTQLKINQVCQKWGQRISFAAFKITYTLHIPRCLSHALSSEGYKTVMVVWNLFLFPYILHCFVHLKSTLCKCSQTDHTDRPLSDHVQHQQFHLGGHISCLCVLWFMHVALLFQCPLEVGAFNDKQSNRKLKVKGHWNYQASQRLQPFGGLRRALWRRWEVQMKCFQAQDGNTSRCCQSFSRRDVQQDVLLGAYLSSRASQQPKTCSLSCDSAETAAYTSTGN